MPMMLHPVFRSVQNRDGNKITNDAQCLSNWTDVRKSLSASIFMGRKIIPTAIYPYRLSKTLIFWIAVHFVKMDGYKVFVLLLIWASPAKQLLCPINIVAGVRAPVFIQKGRIGTPPLGVVLPDAGRSKHALVFMANTEPHCLPLFRWYALFSHAETGASNGTSLPYLQSFYNTTVSQR